MKISHRGLVCLCIHIPMGYYNEENILTNLLFLHALPCLLHFVCYHFPQQPFSPPLSCYQCHPSHSPTTTRSSGILPPIHKFVGQEANLKDKHFKGKIIIQKIKVKKKKNLIISDGSHNWIMKEGSLLQ